MTKDEYIAMCKRQVDKKNMKELDKLEAWLKQNGIKYERIDEEEWWGRHQICVPCVDTEKREWDAICQHGSYGVEKGLLEIYGSIVRKDAGDSVEGWLTAKEVIQRIIEHEEEQ